MPRVRYRIALPLIKGLRTLNKALFLQATVTSSSGDVAYIDMKNTVLTKD